MSDYHICEVDPVTSGWVFDGLHDLEVANTVEMMGEDLAISAEWNRDNHADERTALKGLLVALPGDAPAGPRGRFGLPTAPSEPVELLGTAEVALPLSDNRHLADDVYLQVRADARRRGIGSALWREVVRIAAEQGRDTVLGWSDHLTDVPDDLPRLRARDGEDEVPLDRASLFARSLGLSLAQVERQSRLPLPVPAQRLAELRAEAEAHALPEYRIESWVGPTPEEYLDHVAVMNRALSTDAPLGEVAWEPEVWDAERARQSDERAHLSGHSLVTLAVHAATGETAGVTKLHVHDAHPHRPEQWQTVVAGPHRGHRLGLLLKVMNLQQLAADEPLARYVDTWNAGENAHMLAINTLLGFRPHSAHGAWQTKLSSAAAAGEDSKS
jgi:GNAT superfamily N-acetyltransferase